MSGRAEYERHAAQAGQDGRQDREPYADPDPVGDPPQGRPGAETGEPAPDPGAGPLAGDSVDAGDEHDGEAAAAPADAGEAAPADPEQLGAALAEAQRQRDEYLDLLRRERAEFENFRKRANRERMEALDRGAEGVISDLLGVLDDFDRVLDAAERSDDTQLAKGVEMVHGRLRGVLAEAGLESVPGVGAPFDPNFHEAMMQVEADEPVEQPTVFEVLRPGYRFKGRVLRPASVSVAQ